MRAALLFALLLPSASAGPMTAFAGADADGFAVVTPEEPQGTLTQEACPTQGGSWHGSVEGPDDALARFVWNGNATIEWYWAVDVPIPDAITVIRLMDRADPALVARSDAMALVPGEASHESVDGRDVHRVEVPVEVPAGRTVEADRVVVSLEAGVPCQAASFSMYSGPDRRSALHVDHAIGLVDPDVAYEAGPDRGLLALYGSAAWGRQDIGYDLHVQGPADVRPTIMNMYCCGYRHADGHPIVAWSFDRTGPGEIRFGLEAWSNVTGQRWAGQAVVPGEETVEEEAPGVAFGLLLLALALVLRRPPPCFTSAPTSG